VKYTGPVKLKLMPLKRKHLKAVKLFSSSPIHKIGITFCRFPVRRTFRQNCVFFHLLYWSSSVFYVVYFSV